MDKCGEAQIEKETDKICMMNSYKYHNNVQVYPVKNVFYFNLEVSFNALTMASIRLTLNS